MTKQINETESLYAEFKQKAEAVSAQVYRVKDLKEAAALLTTITEEGGYKKIVAAPSPMVDKCLSSAEIKAAVHTEDLRKNAEDACMGLSEMDMAIAEIGSLQQDSTDVNQRLVSTLPNVHVALVKTESLVANLSEALSIIGKNKDKLPGYISFITGPSRTADIERVLTIGVHGPAELKVIFVDRAGGDAQ
ncbi:LutC/YkgG family protein [Desulfofalx alkaliphila]|uniref:LutC/YkgG family protein n=1 Tax=Desulfofalx alkaliphila TaxID=105483 RepID=UPI0006922493|nr:lactate utilization protein [Desulfofalx alkaliphila]